jgi:predicted aspartyl protease
MTRTMTRTMTRVAIAVAALIAASPALADEWYCHDWQIFTGKVNADPVTSTLVSYDPSSGAWRVTHGTSHGKAYNRADQYTMSNYQSRHALAAWDGLRIVKPNLRMVGQISHDPNGVLVYQETLLDNNVTVYQGSAICRPANASSRPIEAQVPSAPAPVAVPRDAVPLYTTDGWRSMSLAVGLGGNSYPFTLDTGATDMSVTWSIADQLVRGGEAVLGRDVPSTLADGSQQINHTIIIHSVTIGGRTVHDVVEGVTPDGGMMLLGMSILNPLGASINVTSHTLHLGS